MVTSPSTTAPALDSETPGFAFLYLLGMHSCFQRALGAVQDPVRCVAPQALEACLLRAHEQPRKVVGQRLLASNGESEVAGDGATAGRP